jgi:hypothetical protein
MPELTLAAVEETKNIINEGLDLVLAATTAPQRSTGAYKAAKRIPFLARIREMLRVDLSEVELSGPDQRVNQIILNMLKSWLEVHRNVAAKLEHLLQVKDPGQRKRIRDLVGSRGAIESVLEAVEDRIEDLEIATNPEVRAAIEQLIDEAKAP